MKLYILFGQRKESYEGEHAPEALVCWEEDAVDGNAEGFEEAVEAAQAKYNQCMIAMRVIEVTVDQKQIRQMLIGKKTVAGTIVTPQQDP
jgi:hypothetical protein